MQKRDLPAIEGISDASGDKSGRRDRGFTLTEVVVSIGLMGVVITVLLSAILTVIRVSSTSDNAAKVEAMLTSAADRLAGWTYLPCPEANEEGYDAIVGAAAADVDWDGSQVIITKIRYWDPTDGGALNAADGNWVDSNGLSGTAACAEEDVNLTTARTLQQVTIQGSSPNGDIVRTLQVVKSNVGEKTD